MNSEQEKKLTQLKAAYENGFLDEGTYQAAIAGITATQAQTESGAIAQGANATAVAERGVAVGGDVNGDIITGNIYHGRPTDDPKEALRIYREVLVNSNTSLPMQGIDKNASDPTAGGNPLGLTHVYINLDTTATMDVPEEDRKERDHPSRSPEKETMPLPALQAVIQNRQLVLLGDPGGGKTTFVRHLAHALAAHHLHPDSGWLNGIPGWQEEEAALLPIVVILRDFARNLTKTLPAKADPGDLLKFILSTLDAQNLSFAADAIEQTLEAGNAMLLFDGLDEVPTQAQRIFVRDAVAAFVERYRANNRVLLTCRIMSYQKPVDGAVELRLPTDTYPSFELAPFNEEKIDQFIARWYQELARLHVVKGQDVEGVTRKFQKAVRRKDLWRLAPNPLLLTVMAFVHTHKGRLPDDRALLYQEAIDILLWRWEQIKQGGQEDTPRLRQLLNEANRADMDLQVVLWELAFAVHRQVDGDETSEKVADIGEFELVKALGKLKKVDDAPDLTWATKLVKAMKVRAGLLVERMPGVFTFPHRTFQEYMAGAHLSRQPDFATKGVALATEGDLWREVILLAVGRLVHTSFDTSKPLALVAELCPPKATDDESSWYKAWLAGDVLLDMGMERTADTSLGRELLARVRGRIADLVDGGKLTPRQRLEAGDTLARLGDKRQGVGVRVVDGVPVPDIELCIIPPGSFWMGSGDDDSMARENEKPQRSIDVPYGYGIGRYPVTVAQFRLFVEQSGYRGYYNDDLTDALEEPDNRPVRYVTWHDALAFCRWLDTVWHQQGLLPEGVTVTLPSELEWEKAARGGLRIPQEAQIISDISKVKELDEAHLLKDNRLPKRRFSWGDKPDIEKANSNNSGLGTTTVVGAYPAGVSPYGASGMNGNLFEWTRSVWGKDFSEPEFKYPYDVEENGREDVELGDEWLRVIRGGSWATSENSLRCAYRNRSYPNYRNYNLGFRVCVSPFFTDGR